MLRRLACALLLSSLPFAAGAQLLYNNGGIQTGTGNGANGQNTSEIGFSNSGTAGGVIGFTGNGTFSLADDFTVPAGQSWSLTGVSILAYVTATYGFPPVSPYSGVTIRIHDLSPDNPASTILSTSTTLISNTFTGTYRVTSTTLTNSQRPVFELQADFSGVTLPEGTYWIDFDYSAGFTPPVTVFDPVDGRPELVAGNAMQNQNGTWVAAIDAGMQVAMPFSVFGSSVTAVPEPGTWLAAGLSLAGLAWTQRRRWAFRR